MRAQNVEERLQQHFEAAQKAQQAGDLDTAAREYRAAIQLNPQIAELYANLGLVYYAQSKFSDSAAALDKAARLKPGLRGVNLWLGINDVKLGEPAKALPLLREAVRENPTDLQAERFYGAALWSTGQTFAAIDQMVKTCSMFPADTDSFFVLSETYRKAANHEMEAVLAASTGKPFLHLVFGDIYQQTHQWARATQHYQSALQQAPQTPGAHLGLGEVHLAQWQIPQAEEEFRKELAIDPDSVEAQARLAQAELFEGKTVQAVEQLQQAIKRSPWGALAVFHFYRALPETSAAVDAASSLQQTADALQAMPSTQARSLALAIVDAELDRPALKNDLHEYEASLPEISSLQSAASQAQAHFALGHFQSAEAVLRPWLATHPGDVQARYLFAQALKQLSLESAAQVMAMSPDSPRMHQLLGQMYADRREDDKALAEYKLAEQANPSLPDVHYQVGHLEWQFGDREDALAELHRELAIDPYHAEANGEIGSILLVQNQPQAAIPYLQTALRIDPTLTVAHQQLGKAYAMLKDYSNAEAELLQAAPSDLDGSVYYQLWQVYRAEGKKQQADAAIARCQMLRTQKTDEEQSAERGPLVP